MKNVAKIATIYEKVIGQLETLLTLVSFDRLPIVSVFKSVSCELIILHRLHQLLLAVHHERPALSDGLSNWLA